MVIGQLSGQGILRWYEQEYVKLKINYALQVMKMATEQYVNVLKQYGEEQIQEQAKQLPFKKFRVGNVAATIWQRNTEKGAMFSIQVTKSYKDKENNWKNTNSLGQNDLPKAILALQKSYEFLALNEPSMAATA